MATSGTGIKGRCRLCYTRLKDSSSSSSPTTTASSHQKFCCTQHNHRIYNIYKRRPFAYRDLIVRYLFINLPESSSVDQYSTVICGSCASSLDELDAAFRTFDETQKSLRLKFRKTSHIIRCQVNQRTAVTAPAKSEQQQAPSSTVVPPKRQSKRKGAPKHIDQTVKKVASAVQMIVRIRSPSRDDDDDDASIEPPPSKRPNHRRKPSPANDEILTESTNHKKRFKRGPKDSEASYNCVNLLKPSSLTDISMNHRAPLNLSTPGSTSAMNSRSANSVKGNHIERIAVSLLSGTETASDNGLHQSSSTTDYHPSKNRVRRKPASSALEATNILPTGYTNVAAILSPSMVEQDDELSNGEASNDSSTPSIAPPRRKVSNAHVSKQLSSSISTTPTSDGLTITAINQTGQKQVFMAKQLGNLKKYQCGLCEKIVTNIQIHVRRHTNDKPYPCTYCEKRFTNSGDLQIHVRIHTGEKPYACPLCLKSYRTIGNFNSHVKTHDSGIRPHRCELCSQTFPIPKDWYSHLRSSHRSRIPSSSTPTPTLPATAKGSRSTLSSPNTTTTVTQPLFSNTLSSHQQYSEVFVPNRVKLEPINRSQLLIKPSNANEHEPVNMSKKEHSNGLDDDEEEDDDDDEDLENDDEHRQSTHNLLSNVSSPVHA